VTVVEVDADFKEIPGTEKTFQADTLLVAVGLDPVDELYQQAKRFGMRVHSAGDALEIAEASAAIFSGRIAGREIARALGKDAEVPGEWRRRWEVLKSKPGKTYAFETSIPESGLFPVIRCVQEIPCDPCIHICPKNIIAMKGDPVFGLPEVTGDECTGCTLCVAECPGLAITLVDLRGGGDQGLVTVPFEILTGDVTEGDEVEAVDMDGHSVCRARVDKVARRVRYDRTVLVTLRVPAEKATAVAGFRIQPEDLTRQVESPALESSAGGGAGVDETGVLLDDDTIICRCERVKAGEIRKMIRRGVRDLNQLKVLRCGMGACGGKTCQSLILKLFRDEGVDLCDVIPFSRRPLVAEVDLGMLAGEPAGNGDRERSVDGAGRSAGEAAEAPSGEAGE
jgi:Fe-S-cluster-containing hydrogenase component 2/bacterioferritin-associated ferredoxin